MVLLVRIRVLIEDPLLALVASSLSRRPPRQCFPREEVQTVYFLSEIMRLTSIPVVTFTAFVHSNPSFLLCMRRVIMYEDITGTLHAAFTVALNSVLF